jgi:hypothetical protein
MPTVVSSSENVVQEWAPASYPWKFHFEELKNLWAGDVSRQVQGVKWTQRLWWETRQEREGWLITDHYAWVLVLHEGLPWDEINQDLWEGSSVARFWASGIRFWHSAKQKITDVGLVCKRKKFEFGSKRKAKSLECLLYLAHFLPQPDLYGSNSSLSFNMLHSLRFKESCDNLYSLWALQHLSECLIEQHFLDCYTCLIPARR